MRTAAPCLLAAAALAAAPACAWAAGGAASPAIEFVQYADEATAVGEVSAGNLDMYYYPARPGGQPGVEWLESPGGSFSLLLNPAEGDRLNPFSLRGVRYAVHFMVDRGHVVDEVLGGRGAAHASNYGPSAPEYALVLDAVEPLGIRHDPARAAAMVREAMEGAGAEERGGVWHHGGEPVAVSVLSRSDDPARRAIGEMLASALERAGFAVEREYGDLSKAYAVVYGTDPAELEWHAYTEGWSGRPAVVRYDAVGPGQMYAPWFSLMPGYNNPAYWNYENASIDGHTQRLYGGDFSSEEERAGLVRASVAGGVSEAVRVFLASRTDAYAVGSGVSGVVNDLGAGIANRYTAAGASSGGGPLRVGVKQIYEGAWNPVMGFSDLYSRHVWDAASDPAVARHPSTGAVLPARASWEVETRGPGGSLEVPPDAVLWDPASGSWREVGPGARAASAVSFEYEMGSWHHGPAVDMSDVMYAAYFAREWGSEGGPGDPTRDPEYTPRAAQAAASLAGLRETGPSSLEVYVDYWHFDEGEIAAWASVWPEVPWEVGAAMEEAVLSGRASFSRSGAASSQSQWLSLIVPRDAALLSGILAGMAAEGAEHPALAGRGGAGERYEAASAWIAERGHAAIGNGPFYVERYSPDARTIRLAAHEGGYHGPAGRWDLGGAGAPPEVLRVEAPAAAAIGAPLRVLVESEGADSVAYYLTGAGGELAASGSADAGSGLAEIEIPGSETAALPEGAADLRVFAVSDEVPLPGSYSTSLLASRGGVLPGAAEREVSAAGPAPAPWPWLAAGAAAAGGGAAALLAVRRAAASRRL